MKTSTIFGGFWGKKTCTLSGFLRPHLVYPTVLFLFSTLRSRMSKNRCKLLHKLCNSQNIPLEVRILENMFSKYFYKQLGQFFPLTNLRSYY